MATAAELGYEILEVARRWRRARVTLRAVLDKKSATAADIATAKREYNALMDKLEVLVGKLEALVQGRGLVKRKGKPFPWRELFGVAAAGIQTLGEVLDKTDGLAGGGARPAQRVKSRIVGKDGVVEAEIMEDDE